MKAFAAAANEERRQLVVGNEHDTVRFKDRRVTKIHSIVADSPRVCLRELAHELNLSSSRVEHLFTKHTGRCLREHIVHARMSRAAHMLRTTELRVKEIAAHLGYAHTPSFVRTFLNFHGTTPHQYRIAAHA